MFVLCLNDMRSSNAEITISVFRSEEREPMEKFLKDERVETYKDGTWGKVFRAGGPLEWYNEPYEHLGQGILEVSEGVWVEEARQRWQNMVQAIPELPHMLEVPLTYPSVPGDDEGESNDEGWWCANTLCDFKGPKGAYVGSELKCPKCSEPNPFIVVGDESTKE